jgi:hypothetical protein
MRSKKDSTPNSLQTAGPSPGWVTKRHNRYISKDTEILKQMQDAFGKRGEFRMLNLKLNFSIKINYLIVNEASIALRQHLSSRTAAMLAPLNRYLNTLIPSPSEKSVRLKPFNDAQFFASLKAHGAQLPFKSNNKQRQFYERWLRTPAFGVWLAQQEEAVTNVLTARESSPR